MVSGPTLFPEVRESAAPAGRGFHGYYRKTNGWIMVGATTPTNKSDFEFKGYQFLAAYGQFTNGTSGGDARERDVNGAPWNPADEPWRLIFQKNGAREFPVDQIIAYQWHIRPPYREVTFPQLDGIETVDIPCPECDRVFSGTSDGEVAQNLKSHLTTRVNARHSYTPTDLRELGKELGMNFDSARTRVVRRTVRDDNREVASLTPEPPAIALTPGEMQVNTAYLCNACSWGPPITSKNPGAALRMHQRSHE